MAARRSSDPLLPLMAVAALGLGLVVYVALSPSDTESPTPASAAPEPEPPAAEPAASADEPAEPSDPQREEADHLAHIRAIADPARAFEEANEGHQRFSDGAYFADREIVAIRALVRLGQKDLARTRAQNLLKRFPDHPQADRVRKMVGL